MQLSNLEGPEAIAYYLSGIRDDIRSYIVSHEANTTDLESIQRACLRQDHVGNLLDLLQSESRS